MEMEGRKKRRRFCFWYYCSEENCVKKETKSKRGG
jgi:hypothetical protein